MPKSAMAPTSSRKPKLGQHFLASEGAAQRIVDALGDVSQSTVLEIGPGRGAITELLARKSRRLIAVELDRVLSAQLRMQFNMLPNVEIIEGDILKIELNTVFGLKPGMLHTGLNFSPEPARVVGNLPYYITSDILLRLLEYHRYFSIIVIMVQKEVADRLAASAGSRDYGLLSATAQLYGRVEQLHAAAGRVRSASQGSFQRRKNYDQAPTGIAAGSGGRFHCISETVLWAEEEDSLE